MPQNLNDLAAPAAAGHLLSIQAGMVREMPTPGVLQIDDTDATWTSGIFKAPVAGPVRVTAEGLQGDEQADLYNHGGPDNVVLAYDISHYPFWRRQLDLPDLPAGGFGENFTIEGFTEETVCIGDIWAIGDELKMQVSQTRQLCYKLARRLDRPEVIKFVRQNSWGGWYLRVLTPGLAQAGMPITRIQRFHPEWNVARAVQTMYARRKDPASAQALAALPELSTRWKNELLD